jgi:hypothetical protein
MDRHVIAHGGQPLCLLDDGIRVFVAKQYEGDFCHFVTVLLRLPSIVYLDKGECALNKPAFLFGRVFCVELGAKGHFDAAAWQQRVMPVRNRVCLGFIHLL